MANKSTLKAISDLKKLNEIVDSNIIETLDTNLDAGTFEENYNFSFAGKTRVWLMLLYPDNEEHQQILESLPRDFPQAIWAHHDRDISTETGEILKDHVHVVLYFTNDVYKSHITKKYAWCETIERWVRPAKNIRERVRYLIHADDPDKYQYPYSYLEGNVKPYEKFIDREQTEADKAKCIIHLIKTQTFSDLADLIVCLCDNGLYAVYRKSAYTFNMIYSETQKQNQFKYQ